MKSRGKLPIPLLLYLTQSQVDLAIHYWKNQLHIMLIEHLGCARHHAGPEICKSGRHSHSLLAKSSWPSGGHQ